MERGEPGAADPAHLGGSVAPFSRGIPACARQRDKAPIPTQHKAERQPDSSPGPIKDAPCSIPCWVKAFGAGWQSHGVKESLFSPSPRSRPWRQRFWAVSNKPPHRSHTKPIAFFQQAPQRAFLVLTHQGGGQTEPGKGRDISNCLSFTRSLTTQHHGTAAGQDRDGAALE